ncbi:MAG: PASTA domain-containing protein [Actinomycetota bacterium]|nr:PASTA domain-containing protein [Actinomycetota bacterium]
MGQRGLRKEPAVVPALVGLTAVVAHDVALDAQLLAVDQDPRHAPTVPGVVAAQDPPAGSAVARGHRVRIWVQTSPDEDGGGGSGGLPVPSGPTPLTPAGAK